MKYLFVILLAITTNAMAFDLLLGQYTHHFHDQVKKGRAPFKNEHPLIGISTEKLTIIAMENSYNKFSAVVLRTDKHDFTPHLRGAISIGIATGYQESPTAIKLDGVIPVGYLSLDIHPKADKYGLTITLAPDEFLGAGLRFKF